LVNRAYLATEVAAARGLSNDRSPSRNRASRQTGTMLETPFNITSSIFAEICAVVGFVHQEPRIMTREPASDSSPIRPTKNWPRPRSSFSIVKRETINLAICAFVLFLAGASCVQFAFLTALCMGSCLVAFGSWDHQGTSRKRRTVTNDYLLSCLATALFLVQWCYVAIVALGDVFGSHTVILRSISSS